MATGLDIRSRVLAEQTLIREREFIDKALNSLPGLFYVLDDEGQYIRVNNGFIDQLEYSWDEVNGTRIELRFKKDDRMRGTASHLG